MGYRWTWILAAAFVVFLAVFAGWFMLGGEGERNTADRQRPLRPATINNVLLRIESNISRIQSTMENLVFSEYPANLANDVDSVNQMAETVDRDFLEMGALLPTDNPQYRKALAQLHEWKEIRDEIIKLTTEGPSPLAKEIVRSKSAVQVQKLMASLDELDSFSQKRIDDFNTEASDTQKEKTQKQ